MQIELYAHLYGMIKHIWQIHSRYRHVQFTGKNKVRNTTRAELLDLID